MDAGRWLAASLAALALALGATGAPGAMSQKEKDKARAEIAKMERETLGKLYRLQPGAKPLEQAAVQAARAALAAGGSPESRAPPCNRKQWRALWDW